MKKEKNINIQVMSNIRKVVRLEIKPSFSKKFLEEYDNLGKLRDWW